jgi:hypothetical protein
LALTLVCVLLLVLMYTRTGVLTGPFTLEAAEWLVTQEQPGEIVTRQTTGRREVTQSVQVYEFPRGDVIRLNLASNLMEGSIVAAQTPIMELASLTDVAMEKLLVARTNRLAAQIGLLQQGEGTAKIGSAEASLALAQTNLQSYLPLVQRRRTLVDQGILSRDELQVNEDEYNRRMQEVVVAQAEVDVRRMQVAPGVVTMAQAEFEEACQELSLVQERLAARWLIAPVGGRLTRISNTPDILLRVINERDMSARVIVPIIFADQLAPGDPVELVFTGMAARALTSAIERVELQSVPQLGQSVAHLIVPVDNRDGRLRVAQTGQAIIHNIRANPLSALWRRVRLAGVDIRWQEQAP